MSLDFLEFTAPPELSELSEFDFMDEVDTVECDPDWCNHVPAVLLPAFVDGYREENGLGYYTEDR